MLQLVNRYADCRILLCTPSNSAADLLVELLDQVVSRIERKKPEECAMPMVRLYGAAVSIEEVFSLFHFHEICLNVKS